MDADRSCNTSRGVIGMPADLTQQPGITIHQVYLESARFSHRADFLALPPNYPIGELQTELTMAFALDSADDSKAALRATLRTMKSDGAYDFEVTVGAVVQAAAVPNFTVAEYAGTSGAALLIPFLREHVAAITGRGRFGPVWLHPMNILAIAQRFTDASRSEAEG